MLPRAATLIGVLAVTAVVVACGARSSRPAGVDLDAWLRAEVVRLLEAEERIAAADLRVESRDGVVMISGVMPNVENARRALEIAASVDGVVQVVNRIRVLTGGAESPKRGRPSEALERLHGQ